MSGRACALAVGGLFVGAWAQPAGEVGVCGGWEDARALRLYLEVQRGGRVYDEYHASDITKILCMPGGAGIYNPLILKFSNERLFFYFTFLR